MCWPFSMIAVLPSGMTGHISDGGVGMAVGITGRDLVRRGGERANSATLGVILRFTVPSALVSFEQQVYAMSRCRVSFDFISLGPGGRGGTAVMLPPVGTSLRSTGCCSFPSDADDVCLPPEAISCVTRGSASCAGGVIGRRRVLLFS